MALKILLLFLSNLLCLYCQVPRPRGVSLSKASFYQPGAEFVCLDGSLTIAFDRINDDYCDCADGSDEPGTSACPNGSFHCTNAGYKPKYIPSSMADDGICDCCDGTDEYTGKVTCPNTCKELGKQMREEQEKMRSLIKEGNEIYKEYVQQGMAARAEKQEKVDGLRSEQEELKATRDKFDEMKEEAEKLEKEATTRHKEAWEAEKDKIKNEQNRKKATEAFSDLDTNGDQLISVTEMQSRIEFDIDNNGDVSPEEGQEYLEDNESVDFDFFYEKVWDNIKQVYRKPGSEGQETEAQVTTPPPFDIKAATEPDDDIGEEDGHYDEDRYDDDDDDYYGDEDDEDDFRARNYPRGDGADYGQKEQKTEEVDADFPMPEYDEETKKLIADADEARSNYNEANRKFSDVDRDLKDTEDLLRLDLGANNEFYPLHGQCYEYTDREYTYKLCPFDRCSQRSKNGGSETSLGRWGQWVGPESNRYSVMQFEKGQNCWHGPDRQVKVKVSCGVNNALLSATEPNRCEYEYTFTTPAACIHLPDQHVDPNHDEL